MPTTAEDLRRQADELEQQGHAAGTVPESLDLWRRADRLRAQADALESSAVDWLAQVHAMTHAAARELLGAD